jgi:DNA modification methylase
LDVIRAVPDSFVDLIYCDILYNTGKQFADYDDRLGSPEEAIAWYRPRLMEMKRVLKPTGLIYLQMDHRLVHYMKVMMDSLFGIRNFRRDIVWCYSGGGISKSDFPAKHDNILKYSKSEKFTYNPVYKPYSAKTQKRGRTKCKGPYAELNREGTPLTDWWDDIAPLHSPTCRERVGYNTQKPMELLKRIIASSSNEGDVVADFFCGSGTTLVAAAELKRVYIGCDINSRAVELSRKRLEMIDHRQ